MFERNIQMAASSKARVARRAAKGKINNAIVNSKATKKIDYNAKGNKLRAAIAKGIAVETSTQARAVVDQVVAAWAAINAGEMAVTTEHTKRYLNDVRDGVIEARKAVYGLAAEEPAAVNASRVGDMNAVLLLHDWKCRNALAAAMASMDGLASHAITKIARWMRGAHGKNGNWSPTQAKAPSVKVLMTVTRKKIVMAGTHGGGNRTTGNARRGNRGGGPTGMPMNEMLRSHDHCVACLTAYEKKHRATLGASERTVINKVIGSLGSIRAKVSAAAKEKAKADAKIAADAAKAKKIAADKAKKEGK